MKEVIKNMPTRVMIDHCVNCPNSEPTGIEGETYCKKLSRIIYFSRFDRLPYIPGDCPL